MPLEVAGLQFRNNFVVGSGPAVKTLDMVKEIERCGLCVNIGHCYAIAFENEKADVLAKDCTGCSTCVDICPAGAVSMEQHEEMRNSNE